MQKKPTEIGCEEIWRQISAYLDDEVDSGLRATMAAHFKHCSRCRAVLDGTRNVVRLVGDGKTFQIPAKLSDNFYKKLKRPHWQKTAVTIMHFSLRKEEESRAQPPELLPIPPGFYDFQSPAQSQGRTPQCWQIERTRR